MKCMICGSQMHFFFKKTFTVFDLGDVEYWRCGACGFCASRTHGEMTEERWDRLNTAYHRESHRRQDNPYNRNQRYFNQALMLFLMAGQGLIRQGAWLDWGCGTAQVARLLKENFAIDLLTYDRYFVSPVNAIRKERLIPGSFDLVVNTAVFEHVRDRRTLDGIASYVGAAGCFAIHTLVPEAVPEDPDWMYLLPVHCSFHTNRSMQILMDSWGFTCSVYNESAKMWVLFRREAKEIETLAEKLNRMLGWEYLHFKNGFMDYWK